MSMASANGKKCLLLEYVPDIPPPPEIPSRSHLRLGQESPRLPREEQGEGR